MKGHVMPVEPIIREFKKTDIANFHEAVSESIKEAYYWLPWCHPGYSIDEARSWILMQESLRQGGHEYNFLIVDRRTDLILGGTGINTIHNFHKFCFLGYWVRSSQTGKGIATSATMQTARFAFEEIGLNRIEILMAVDNAASKRVAEKTNAKYEGIARQKLFLHNTFVDAHVFTMLRNDYVTGHGE